MDATDEDPYVDRSYRRTVGRLNIPGFRKGKAPRSIVENYVGRIALVQEALDFMIPETLNQVLQDEDIQAFVEPRVEVLELEPVSFNATVPLEPTVDLGDFYNVRLEKDAVEISDDEVDQVLERIRREMAPWEPVSRPVQFGDLLNLNVQGAMAGEQVVDDEAVDYIPRLENVLPFPGFALYLEDMTEGQSKDFTLTVPEEYPRPEYAGKDVAFQVEVLSIKEKQLPELDDEFAKGVGEGFETMEALRAHVVGRITEEAQSQADYEFQELSLASLLENATINASDLLLEREIQNLQQERERMLRNQRLDLDTYLSYIGKTEEEFQEELRPVAEDRLNRMLVLRKLAQEEQIEVAPEEVQEEVDSMVSSSSEENAAAMRRALNSEDTRESIRASLLNRKVMERLMEIFQGIEGAEDLAETTTEMTAETAAGSESDADQSAGESEPSYPSEASDSAAATGDTTESAATDSPTNQADPSETDGSDEGAKPDAE
jgi:trigger factor